MFLFTLFSIKHISKQKVLNWQKHFISWPNLYVFFIKLNTKAIVKLMFLIYFISLCSESFKLAIAFHLLAQSACLFHKLNTKSCFIFAIHQGVFNYEL